MTEDWNAADEAVEEIRAARHELWARFDHDPMRLLAYFQKVHQEMLRSGWVEAPPRNSVNDH